MFSVHYKNLNKYIKHWFNAIDFFYKSSNKLTSKRKKRKRKKEQSSRIDYEISYK